MSIKKYFCIKDNTIANAFKENLSSKSELANMGSSDILEIFSIFGQASEESLEQSRVLLDFPISKILKDRNSQVIPPSGSVEFRLKLSNTAHGNTTPEKFTISAFPLLGAWDEGYGLDMDSYLDKGASNWVSSSTDVLWHTTGSDFTKLSNYTSEGVGFQYSYNFEKGTEDIDLNITPIVEEWIKSYSTVSADKVAATASISFTSNPSENDQLKIRDAEGKEVRFMFITGATATIGNLELLQIQGAVPDTAELLEQKINSSLKITAVRTNNAIALTQEIDGIGGNTLIDFNFSADPSPATVTHFSGGQSLVPYGLLLKLNRSFEDGSQKRSFYTKRFFSRSSNFFFKRPNIEAQWDRSIKDDRDYIIKHSNLSSDEDNINRIYLFNKHRGNFVNLQNTGSALLVSLRDKDNLGDAGTPESLQVLGGVQASSPQYITASMHSKGIYEAQFSYSGNKTSLYDVWQIASAGSSASETITFTNSLQLEDTVTIVDVSGVSKAYVCKNAEDLTANPPHFTRLGQTTDSVKSLKRCIESQNGHAGSIKCSLSSNELTLTLTQDLPKSFATPFTTLQDLSGLDPIANQATVTVISAGEDPGQTRTIIHTGVPFNIYTTTQEDFYDIPEYSVNITNLKDSYTTAEKATFRIYTRNKNWSPNIYTKATSNAPVNNIRNLFYKITRVSDLYEVVSYSTGSFHSYSSVSYDKKGSFFDFDMSELESNNAYDISFLLKDGSSYLELKEKFRFRVKS